jgi:hypothetical protein
MVIRNSMAIIIAISAVSFSAFAGDIPVIGGEAKITVLVDEAGILNVGAATGVAGVVAKQAVGAVLHGNVSGQLLISVQVNKGGIANVGAGIGAGKTNACQSVGTIGSDCNE